MTAAKIHPVDTPPTSLNTTFDYISPYLITVPVRNFVRPDQIFPRFSLGNEKAVYLVVSFDLHQGKVVVKASLLLELAGDFARAASGAGGFADKDHGCYRFSTHLPRR